MNFWWEARAGLIIKIDFRRQVGKPYKTKLWLLRIEVSSVFLIFIAFFIILILTIYLKLLLLHGEVLKRCFLWPCWKKNLMVCDGRLISTRLLVLLQSVLHDLLHPNEMFLIVGLLDSVWVCQWIVVWNQSTVWELGSKQFFIWESPNVPENLSTLRNQIRLGGENYLLRLSLH